MNKTMKRMFAGLVALIGVTAVVASLFAFVADDPAEAESNLAYTTYDPYTETLTFSYGEHQSDGIFTFDVPQIAMDASQIPWYGMWHNGIAHVVFDESFEQYQPQYTMYWFFNCDVEDVTGMQYLNTSSLINATSMFAGCKYLTYLDMYYFDTSRLEVADMMFAESGLNWIGLTNNFRTLKSAYGMYMNCHNLVSADLYLCMNKVEDISYMFFGCENLKIARFNGECLDVATNARALFGNCAALETINLSNLAGDVEATNMFALYDETVTDPVASITTIKSITMSPACNLQGETYLDFSQVWNVTNAFDKSQDLGSAATMEELQSVLSAAQEQEIAHVVVFH